MEKKLQFKRVENPEGWKPVNGCKFGYICTNISRDVIVWSVIGDADEFIQGFIETGSDYCLTFRDREGEKVPSPTPDEIIWPRFVAVEVEGGFTVLDQWEKVRHELVSPKDVVDRQVDSLNRGLAPRTETGWIPHVPAPKPAPRYIEIEVEGGKSIYDTETKQRRDRVFGGSEFDKRDLKDGLAAWNSGAHGEPGVLRDHLEWIPHELPTPEPAESKPKYERGWYLNERGDLRFVVGLKSDGNYAVEIDSNLYSFHVDFMEYTPVPECTGWDWKPKPKMRPKTLADCPEGVWVPCELTGYGYFVARKDDCYSVSTMNHCNGTITSSDRRKPSEYLVHPSEEVQDSQ